MELARISHTAIEEGCLYVIGVVRLRTYVHQEEQPSVTGCKPEKLSFGSLGRREVVTSFDGGMISSDGGAPLLEEVDRRIGFINKR